MLILMVNELDKNQIKKIRELESICNEFDDTNSNISLSNELNFYKAMNCYFLLYENDALVGIISVFSPIKDTAEISVYINPKSRNKGYFKKLLSAAYCEFNKYNISNLLFVYDTKSICAKIIKDKWNLILDHSEYLLRYNKEISKINVNSNIVIKLAIKDEIDKIVKLNCDVFGDNEDESYNMVLETINNEGWLCYVAYLNDELIGACNANTNSEEITIYGFCISIKYQGLGYGKVFLNSIICLLEKEIEKPITLEVDSNNIIAYNLYINSGFDIVSQYDYYKCNLNSSNAIVNNL